MDISIWVFIMLGFSALLSGMSKSGFSGVSLISVAIFSHVFGKQSVGVLLPLLIIADLTVYPNFKKYGDWKPVWKLLPPILIGIVVGSAVLVLLPDLLTKKATGLLVLAFLGFRLCNQYYASLYEAFVKTSYMRNSSGILVGIATSMANAAGSVSQIYLKTQRYTKNETVGIAGRLFLLVNLIKVPINVSFGFIDASSLLMNLKLAPFVILGVLLGKRLLHAVNEALFEKIIFLSCFLSAVKLIFFS